MRGKIGSNDKELREIPTPGQFRITRERSPEPACSGVYHDFQGEGTYCCACCGYELFSSREKTVTPELWPTFRAPITEERVTTVQHIVHFTVRTAARCGRCNAYLGFLLPDRKPSSWKRYVINSAALLFHDERLQKPAPAKPPAARPVV